MRVLLFIFFCVISQIFVGQNKRELDLPYQRVAYAGDLMSRFLVERVKEDPHYFKKTYPYSTTNLYLNADSTFVVYFVSIEHYQMAVGRWNMDGSIYRLFGDSAKTRAAVINPEFYKKYFKFKTPVAFHFDAVELILDGNVLVRNHRALERNRIELLRSS